MRSTQSTRKAETSRIITSSVFLAQNVVMKLVRYLPAARLSLQYLQYHFRAHINISQHIDFTMYLLSSSESGPLIIRSRVVSKVTSWKYEKAAQIKN